MEVPGRRESVRYCARGARGVPGIVVMDGCANEHVIPCRVCWPARTQIVLSVVRAETTIRLITGLAMWVSR